MPLFPSENQLKLRVMLLATLIITGFCPSFSQSKIDSARITQYVEQIKDAYNLPGVTVSVTDLESTIYLKQFGKISPREQILIGSCSKSFTALLVLRLQEKKLLDTNDPVVKHLNWFQYANKSMSDKVSILDLIHQTSGIPSIMGRVIVKEDAQQSTEKEVARMLSTLEVQSIPGKHEYSNINYRLLGFIIEKVTGKKFGEVLQDEILSPLNLKSTSGFVLDEDDESFPRSFNYLLYYPVLPFISDYTEDEIPAGYISSKASDMAIYLRDLTKSFTQNSGILIDQDLSNTLFTPDTLNGSKYAFGWFIHNWQNREVIMHSGLTEGFITCMIILPEEEKAIFVGTNSSSGTATEIAAGIFHILIDVEPREFSKTVFYLIRSVPILVMILIVLLGASLIQWKKLKFPVRFSNKVKPNLFLVLGVSFGLLWVILFPILYVTTLKVIIRYDPASGISLVLISVSIILISFLRYFNFQAKNYD